MLNGLLTQSRIYTQNGHGILCFCHYDSSGLDNDCDRRQQKMNALKFALCLKQLGVTNLDYSARKKLCNLAYLLVAFGLDIGVPLKSFKWYLHGVYNPEITNLIFALKDVKSKP